MTELPASFGKYYLTEHLATGGMATIYLATLRGPLGFEKQVVIKQIHPRLSGQQAFVDLFAAEARTLVALNHGNVVPVYELGMVDDTYFIAMEYVDGPTLLELTDALTQAGARLPAILAGWIAGEMLAGLDHAHRRGAGVIHRDLSPRNVMLSRDGEVKLVDFGIAVSLGSGDDGDGPPTGSFPYMSPEQVRREALTPQSDLFSVGVLLWELLTGTRLFAGADAEATLAAVADRAITAPSTVAGQAAEPFDAIVLRALARDRTARWPTATDFRAALNRVLYAHEPAPSSRELAPLIGQYCPPHRRRRASSVGHLGLDAPRLADGPGTSVMPRGKPPRAKTFATNIVLEAALAPSAEAAPEAAALAPSPVGQPHRRPRRLLAAVLAAAVIATAIVWLARGSAVPVVMAPAAGSDATATPMVIAPDARLAIPIDAARYVLTAVVDARPRVLDARPNDARMRHDDAAAAPVATARLKIGAAPWGEFAVDGKPGGRTPAIVTVKVGSHEIDIWFPASTPPRRETFHVTVGEHDERSVFADFTR